MTTCDHCGVPDGAYITRTPDGYWRLGYRTGAKMAIVLRVDRDGRTAMLCQWCAWDEPQRRPAEQTHLPI